MPDPVYHVRCANLRSGLDVDTHLTDTNDSADLEYSKETLKLVYAQVEQCISQCEDNQQQVEGRYELQAREGESNLPAWNPARQGEVSEADWISSVAAYVEQHFLVNKKAVIERDTDLLTRDELVTHSQEVAAAILAELKTWLKYECFTRRDRRTARNVVDCKWVIKWKQELLPDGSKRRIIRARLTIRGFKDIEAADLTRYAGTSQRYSQRMLCSEAANRRWPLMSTDISKAFLQGVTYKELAEMTGEPLRDVCFYLPPSSVEVLKQLPGYEDFNPAIEVLWCSKPGTGSVDAPRAFSMKLGKVTKDECALAPTRTDGEMLILHKGGCLLAVITVHVDDLKMTGEKETLLWIVDCLERVFGKLILQWHHFTNCGIRHIQDPQTFAITLDQIEYANALKPIVHGSMKGATLTAIVSVDLFEQFRSLRGAVAYTLLTRTDVSVYVVFLQRACEDSTTFGHIKMLNIVVKRLQTHPQSLTYEYLGEQTMFLVTTDAAFKKEEDTGHALKGTIILRKARGSITVGKDEKVHIIDFLTKRVGNVTRSTFSAELFSLCDAADHALILRQIAHEFNVGPLTAAQARDLREGKIKSEVHIELAIDAMSVFSACTAAHIKIPTEKSLLSHVQFVRELLDRGIMSALLWFDTRDMLADGMTKGAVDRTGICNAMSGSIRINHEVKRWAPLVYSGPPAIDSDTAEPELPTANFFVLAFETAQVERVSIEKYTMPIPKGHPSQETWDAAREDQRERNFKKGGSDVMEERSPSLNPYWDSNLLFVNACLESDVHKQYAFSQYTDSHLQDLCLQMFLVKDNKCCVMHFMSDEERDRISHGDFHRCWHGTFASSLPGIILEGLRANYGAGKDERIRFWGSDLPLVYASPDLKGGRGIQCALGYPQALWCDASQAHVGERATLDESPPLRCLLECWAPNGSRVWERKKDGNLQQAYLPGVLKVAQAYIYSAERYDSASYERPVVQSLGALYCKVPFVRPWCMIGEGSECKYKGVDVSLLTGRQKRAADGSKRLKEYNRRQRRAEEGLAQLPVKFESSLCMTMKRILPPQVYPFHSAPVGTPPATPLTAEQTVERRKEGQKRRRIARKERASSSKGEELDSPSSEDDVLGVSVVGPKVLDPTIGPRTSQAAKEVEHFCGVWEPTEDEPPQEASSSTEQISSVKAKRVRFEQDEPSVEPPPVDHPGPPVPGPPVPGPTVPSGKLPLTGDVEVDALLLEGIRTVGLQASLARSDGIVEGRQSHTSTSFVSPAETGTSDNMQGTSAGLDATQPEAGDHPTAQPATTQPDAGDHPTAQPATTQPEEDQAAVIARLARFATPQTPNEDISLAAPVTPKD